MKKLFFLVIAALLTSVLLLTVGPTMAQVSLLLASQASGGINLGIDFRATSGYVTDPSGDTYDLGAAYPVTRGGLTFGWTSSIVSNSRDRNSSNDARLAGLVYSQSASGVPTCASPGSTVYYKLDLPNGAGTYNVSLAFGDASNSQIINALVCDGSTTKLTFAGINTSATNSFVDATGTVYTEVNWITSQTPVSVTFAGSQMQIIPTDVSNLMTIAHVHLHQ